MCQQICSGRRELDKPIGAHTQLLSLTTSSPPACRAHSRWKHAMDRDNGAVFTAKPAGLACDVTFPFFFIYPLVIYENPCGQFCHAQVAVSMSQYQLRQTAMDIAHETYPYKSVNGPYLAPVSLEAECVVKRLGDPYMRHEMYTRVGPLHRNPVGLPWPFNRCPSRLACPHC